MESPEIQNIPWRRDWSPFTVTPAAEIHTPTFAESPRRLRSAEGVGDRIRAAAFAEIQAEAAFLWAADRFKNEAPTALIESWKILAAEERKHAGWLLDRLKELGQQVPGRLVNDQLWRTLVSQKTAQDFAICIGTAEERGRKAGERFYEGLKELDPKSAEIFKQIAIEELAHVKLVYEFFPEAAAAGMLTQSLV